MINNSQGLFFELLKVFLGVQKTLSKRYKDKEWIEAFNIANEQAFLGVLLTAIERIEEKSFLPSKLILLQWIGNVQIIEQTALEMEESAKYVVNYFRKAGFACHILKGCAVARYYPQPIRRLSGDIDVWLDGGRKKLYNFARAFDKAGNLYGVNYHHIHFHLLEGVHIEVHIWPSYLSSPLRNHRLHKFCNQYKPTIESSMPCLAFDRVFILTHCYSHMCGDGLGFRQVMDYYYVLRQGLSEDERDDSEKWIRKLGMGRFAEGLMWVLGEVFGLEDQFMITEPNEKEGRFILKEILQAGNMGHSDTCNWGSKKTPLLRFFFNLKRDLYLAKYYPHEALWQPIFSVWLFLWRYCNGILPEKSSKKKKVSV